MVSLNSLRHKIRKMHLADELGLLETLAREHGPDRETRTRISQSAATLVRDIRNQSDPGLMEVFLAEYGLSTDEGVALMCLAEALLRVPDDETIDDLIEDKIAPSAWGEHLGKSSSSLVNASTWALMLSGKVLRESETGGIADVLHGAVKRLGEPVIRVAVKRAMKEMGHQFVLGETIAEAIKRGGEQEKKGYTYSYDMLGEAALTRADAEAFYASYEAAIRELAAVADKDDISQNPGISIKLSALHPRYETAQHSRVMAELVPKVKQLALLAKEAGMGLNVDAEEADRLDISLDVIEAAIRSPEFAGWDGFGVVVQAYGKRAPAVIDWLHTLATELDRKFMVRLVKGAYWDTEIKLAQVEGLEGFPVFTRKPATDLSYICCAKKLLDFSDRLYPQFATHNAHTVCAILKMADESHVFEFQRLHGMGEALHALVMQQNKTRCRIYAPVGAHRDLLAYLVRRLLENGANSSFVNQIVDEEVAPEEIAVDPFNILDEWETAKLQALTKPGDLYQPERRNSEGWNLQDPTDIERYNKAREPFETHQWVAGPIVANPGDKREEHQTTNPANQKDVVGNVSHATGSDVEAAIANAREWTDEDAQARSTILNKAADLYEENSGEIFACLCREAGKTPLDAVAEIREAVDFLRYYAARSVVEGDKPARGVITCISPWNFPLAIFTGQIAAALAAGNGVLAKPADPTPIIANIAVRLMHKAGVPRDVLQLLPGEGATVGVKLTSDQRVQGVCFTGSTGVARLINQNAAKAQEPDATFIAETGGLNAMIVDSTALPEQAVRDIVDSAFRSAGQRCSALRVLYLQQDIADGFLKMLYGAMDELTIGDPWKISCDVGPIITEKARDDIAAYIETAEQNGSLLKKVEVPSSGNFVAPSVIKVAGIEDLEREIFGPVLHVATFAAEQIDQVVAAINGSGYGLTFGLHTRIDDRVEHITNHLEVGNIYVNRNQIGAVVGSQPFGGEGLSGTGPKAGGSNYLKRFYKRARVNHEVSGEESLSLDAVQGALDRLDPPSRIPLKTIDMPGPTGESNRWSIYGRGTVLCLGPTAEDAEQQMKIAISAGCSALGIAPGLEGENTLSGVLDSADLSKLTGYGAVALWSGEEDLRKARVALSEREGPLLPLICTNDMYDFCLIERHLCIDTTAAGGNASLLAEQS